MYIVVNFQENKNKIKLGTQLLTVGTKYIKYYHTSRIFIIVLFIIIGYLI